MQANEVTVILQSSSGVIKNELELEMDPLYALADIIDYLAQNQLLRQFNIIVEHKGNTVSLYTRIVWLLQNDGRNEVRLMLEQKRFGSHRTSLPGQKTTPQDKMDTLSVSTVTTATKELQDFPVPVSPVSRVPHSCLPSFFKSSIAQVKEPSPSKFGDLRAALTRNKPKNQLISQTSSLVECQTPGNKKTQKEAKEQPRMRMNSSNTLYTEWHTVASRDDYIVFAPKQPQTKTIFPLEKEPEKFILNLLALLETPTPNVMQLIMECYERNVRHIDLKASQIAESLLSQKKDPYINLNPLLLLGRTLESKSKGKVRVSYSEKQTIASQFTMFHLTTGFGAGFGKGEYLYEDDDDFSFDSIRDRPGRLEEFVGKFKEDMAVRFSTSTDRIIIRDIVRGSIFVSFYYQAGVPVYSNSQKPHLRGRLVKEELLFSELQLSEGDLDSVGDIDFVDKHTAEEQERGFFPYYQAAGWIRYGLKVEEYVTDRNWLSMDGEEGQWAVMYHGVGSPTEKVQIAHTGNVTTTVKAIIDDNLKKGPRQAMGSNTTIITDSHKEAYKYYATTGDEKADRSVGTGVYGSPLISIAQDYADQFEVKEVETEVNGPALVSIASFDAGKSKVKGEYYKLAFQCRVRPDKIRIAEDLPEYWVVQQSQKFIRPYGLLITKESIVREEKHSSLQQQFASSYTQWIKSQQEGANPRQDEA